MRELEIREMEALVSDHNKKVGFAQFPLEHQVVKLIEEVGEVGTAMAECDQTHIREELGDVLIVLIDVINRSGMTLNEVFEAALTKNMTRYNGVIRQQLEAEGYTGRDAYLEAKRRRG